MKEIYALIPLSDKELPLKLKLEIFDEQLCEICRKDYVKLSDILEYITKELVRIGYTVFSSRNECYRCYVFEAILNEGI